MKKRMIALALALMSLLLVACGSGSKNASTGYYAPAYAEEAVYDYEMSSAASYDVAEKAAGNGVGSLGEAKYVENDRKLIYNSNYSIETKAFESDYALILSAIDGCGGFLSSEYTHGTKPTAYGDSGRTASMTLRIPVERYSEFLTALEGVGVVTSKSRSTEDVTTSYYDNEARIELYEVHYQKLMDYLANATEMKDIIELEQEMTDVLYTIDSLKGNKRHMDDRIAYCTVDIYLMEVVEYTEITVSRQTFGERVSDGFNSVLKGLGSFLEDLAVFLISASPVLALLGILFAVIFFPVRASAKKRKVRKQAEDAAKAAKAAEAVPAETACDEAKAE